MNQKNRAAEKNRNGRVERQRHMKQRNRENEKMRK